MSAPLPPAVPEIPVSDIGSALDYYGQRLGFTIDWRGDDIAGISQGDCRLFLTTADFREQRGNNGPVVIWVNLDSRQAVDALHERWSRNGATIVGPPESKPWGLHEFTAADADGNQFRVFYDFATPAGHNDNE